MQLIIEIPNMSWFFVELKTFYKKNNQVNEFYVKFAE
jgi:hypothetical protein